MRASAPQQPSYTATLLNATAAAQAVELQLTTTSHDGLEKTTVRQTAKLAPGAEQAVKLPLQLKKHGYHEVELKIQSPGETRTQKRSLAYLHPDTRERGNWAEGKGSNDVVTLTGAGALMRPSAVTAVSV